MLRSRIVLVSLALGLAAVLLPAAPAGAATACGAGSFPTKPGPGFTVLRGPAALAAVPRGQPVRAWLGADADVDDDAAPVKWTAAMLQGLRLAPGSVVSHLQIDKAGLAGWSASGVRFVKVDFTGASLAGANLAGACFDHGLLNNADFSGARLAGAGFDGVALAGARFDGADLSNAQLNCTAGMVSEGCVEEEATLSFRGAILRNADIAQPFGVLGGALEGALIDHTTLALSDSLFKDLAPARVTSVVLTAPASRTEETLESFTADELARLKQLSGGRLTALFREMGAKPAFDCAVAGLTPVEQAICRGGDLAALDQLMSLTYRRRLDGETDKAPVQAAQVGFLKKRNACAAAAPNERFTCIFNAYLGRLTELGRDFAAAVLRTPGKQRLAALPVVLVAAVKGDALAARALRAYGASPDAATLTVKGRAIAMTATSLGGNGHVCDFEGDLTWNAAKGVWRGAEDSSPLSWLILPDGIALASPSEEARALCGARASWPEIYFTLP